MDSDVEGFKELFILQYIAFSLNFYNWNIIRIKIPFIFNILEICRKNIKSESPSTKRTLSEKKAALLFSKQISLMRSNSAKSSSIIPHTSE